MKKFIVISAVILLLSSSTTLWALPNENNPMPKKANDSIEKTIPSVSEKIEALQAKESEELDKIIAHGFNSTVLITTPKGTGSGFFISEDGYILTNYHVIEGADKAVITTYDKKTYPVKHIRGYSRKKDLALLKIEGTSFPFLEIEATHNIKINEPILIIGHPQGHSWTLTKGYIAGQRIENKRAIIQFSADISPGNSGGPVLNTAGKVCAIATYIETHNIKLSNGSYILDPSDVFKFGVSAQSFANLLEKFKKKKYAMAKVVKFQNRVDATNYMTFALYAYHKFLQELQKSIQEMDYKKINIYSDKYVGVSGQATKTGTNIQLANYENFLKAASEISALGKFLNHQIKYPVGEKDIDATIKNWRKSTHQINKSIKTLVSSHLKSEKQSRIIKKKTIEEFNNSLSSMYKAIVALNKAFPKYGRHAVKPILSSKKLKKLEKFYYHGKLRISRTDLKI